MTVTAAPLLANIPSPDQGVWFLGPVPIRMYALCIIAGIIVAIWWGERRYTARGGDPGVITDIAVFAVPFGLIGGRLYHVATDWPKYFGADADPLDALKIWQGGLGIWGAIALGALGAWIGCRQKGVSLAVVADSLAPGIVTAQAIGRFGNYFNQELYGGSTTLPWGLELYERRNADGLPDALNGTAINHIPMDVVHPTFLYELLWNLGVALLIVWADRRFRMGHGRVFALYVAGYTVGRFWIELMREDPASSFLGVRVNVFTSVIVFLGAVAYLFLVRGGRERLTPEPGVPSDDPATTADVPPHPDTQDPDQDPAGRDPDAQDAEGRDSDSRAPGGEAVTERADRPVAEELGVPAGALTTAGTLTTTAGGGPTGRDIKTGDLADAVAGIPTTVTRPVPDADPPANPDRPADPAAREDTRNPVSPQG